jgi:hypothetical protein
MVNNINYSISSSPAVDLDSTVYISNDNGKLIAIYTDHIGLVDSPWPKFHAGPMNRGVILDVTSISLPLKNQSADYTLYQNYPNPFNPVTHIRFSLAQSEKVKLEVFNILGQKVNTLVNNKLNIGQYEIKWDGKNESGNLLGSGIYFYRLKAGDYIKTRKMIFLK